MAKKKKDRSESERKTRAECPVVHAGEPGSGGVRMSVLIDFLRFEVHFIQLLRVGTKQRKNFEFEK